MEKRASYIRLAYQHIAHLPVCEGFGFNIIFAFLVSAILYYFKYSLP